MWERLIKLRPSLIVVACRNRVDERLFQIALDSDYKINEKDLQRNKSFCKSDFVMRKAIDINPNFIKYYEGYTISLVEEALDIGYIPNISDLENNKVLGSCSGIINYLIRNGHPEAIKYSSTPYAYRINVDEALEAYTPSLEDLKDNNSLACIVPIMKIILREDANAIKYIDEIFLEYEKQEELIKYAIENGYQPTIEDIIRFDKNGNRLLPSKSNLSSSSLIFEELLKDDCNNIKYYTGGNQHIFKMALNLGYKPNISDLESYQNISYSDDIMSELIKNDPSLILKYTGYNKELAILAYNLGFKENEILEKINSISEYHIFFSSDFIMEKLVKKEYNLIEKYQGYSLEPFKAAFDSGYKPNEDFCKKYSNNPSIFGLIICVNPDLIKYYNGYSRFDLYESAIKYGGYILTDDDVKTLLNEKDDSPWKIDTSYIISLAIERQPELIKYYNSRDRNIYIRALKAGFLPTEETIKEEYTINSDLEVMAMIAKIEPNYAQYFKGNMLLLKILAFDYIPTLEEVQNNSKIKSNFDIMKKLIEIDYRYLQYMEISGEKGIELCELAMDIHQEFIPSLKLVDDLNLYDSYKIMSSLLKQDFNIIREYKGTNIDVFKLAIQKGYLPMGRKRRIRLTENNEFVSYTQEDQEDISVINDMIIQMILNNDFSILGNVEHDYKSVKLFIVAFKLGYIPNIKDIDRYLYTNMDEEIIRKMIDDSEISDCLDFMFNSYVSQDIKEYILESKNIDIPVDYITMLGNYHSDKLLFINNYHEYSTFLKESKIDETKFTQFEFLSRYDWFSDIINIVDNGKTTEFNKVKEYFFDNYYFKENKDLNEAIKIKAFVNIMKNYNKYPELCLDIVSQNVELSDELLEKVEFLFATNEILNENEIPKTVNDLKYLESIFSNKLLSEIQDIEEKSTEEIKEIICKQLFNEDLEQVRSLLRTYGTTEEFRQLLFDNRNNEELHDIISEMMIYTSMMESIIEATDKQYLIELTRRIVDNFELSTKCMMIFTRFDEKMQDLYSEELSSNLTNLKNDTTLDSLVDKKMTEECGIEVIDFSDRQYCLLAHVKSYSETDEEVILGKSSSKHNFISLSAISNRNQVFYGYNKDNDIVFGYDSMPDGVFMQSSVSNFGTNGLIGDNSLEVSDGYRQQRGALKTSTAPSGNNSEVLCIREGIKPRYIILPGGRKPTDREIRIAEEYNLKFVKTQDVEQTIENPKRIEDVLLKDKDISHEHRNVNGIKELKSSIVPSKSGPRRIAIFTDSHALFEPTLAILEDARKSGITEIYSLGDNIGTGPNPREVMELLDEYGVESLKGNHEIYAALGVDVLKEHLDSSSGYEEAKRNSTWTRAQLTKEQLDRIRSNPESRIIEIGGQKILLTHYTYDYNTGYKLQIPDGVSHVFEGHVHFENEIDGVTTLRGAGIGNKSGEKNEAYYIVLVEKPKGGFDIERHFVEYDYNSLMYDIKESDMFSEDKAKIESWAGVSR